MIIDEPKALLEVSCLRGQNVSCLWRGYGSAIFLEFGKLQSVGKNPSGEFTVMIEWSWRLEGERSIEIGSWSDDSKIDELARVLKGKKVKTVSFFSRLREIEIAFEGGLWLSSFAISDGDTCGSIKVKGGSWIYFENGRFKLETR